MDNKNLTSKTKVKEEVIYTQIEGTPFTMVEMADKGYTLLIGNTQVVEWNQDKKEIEKMTEIKNLNWASLTSMIAVLVEKWQDIKKEKEAIENK